MKQLVIIGAGGHGKVIADIARLTGYAEILFLDDSAEVRNCGGWPVAGGSADAARYVAYEFIVGVGNAKARQRLQERLEGQKLRIATLIHPAAVVAEGVPIRPGTVVMAGSVINPGAAIGKGCIINTCSSVDHDCAISDYVHVSVGAHIAGTVRIGPRTWIGAGATVSNELSICGDCVIGAGAVVVKDIQKAGIYIGVPAKERK